MERAGGERAILRALLNDFVADGPLPLKSTFDHGGELSLSYFAKSKKLMPYIRGSWVIGQFGNSYEYGAGAKWFPVRTDRFWLSQRCSGSTNLLIAGHLLRIP